MIQTREDHDLESAVSDREELECIDPEGQSAMEIFVENGVPAVKHHAWTRTRTDEVEDLVCKERCRCGRGVGKTGESLEDRVGPFVLGTLDVLVECQHVVGLLDTGTNDQHGP